MDTYILVPLITAEFLWFDNKDDEVIMVWQIEYKYIDIWLFLDGIWVPDEIELTIDDLYLLTN